MKKYLIILFLLGGCSTFDKTMRSTDTFAICKAADVGSTMLGLHSGNMREANPLVASSTEHGYFPLIAFSVILWELLKWADNDNLTLGANVVTCGVAAHNMILLGGAR